MFCTKCGQVLEKDVNFCIKCGTKVELSSTSQIPSIQSKMPLINPSESKVLTTLSTNSSKNGNIIFNILAILFSVLGLALSVYTLPSVIIYNLSWAPSIAFQDGILRYDTVAFTSLSSAFIMLGILLSLISLYRNSNKIYFSFCIIFYIIIILWIIIASILMIA
jgi:hypothetical protein